MKKSWIVAAGIVLLTAAGYGLYETKLKPQREVVEAEVTALESEEKAAVKEEHLLYGINVDELDVVEGDRKSVV